jgi:hypothetical protein
VRVACEEAAFLVRHGDPTSVELPTFPAAAGGAWFTSDPDALTPSPVPTPVPDEPAWRAAARPRTPRRRET